MLILIFMIDDFDPYFLIFVNNDVNFDFVNNDINFDL